MNNFLACVIFCCQSRLFLAETAVLDKVFLVYIPNSTKNSNKKTCSVKKCRNSHCIAKFWKLALKPLVRWSTLVYYLFKQGNYLDVRCDNNYHLFYSYKNFVQKRKENGNTMFFSQFLDKVSEMNGHFPFSAYN